jgi:hypothetical protein
MKSPRSVLHRVRPSLLPLAFAWLAASGAGQVQGATFNNPTSISVSLGGPASPYPSILTVGGLTTAVASVSVTLSNVTHAFSDDLDILLVGPAGQKVMLMSDAGGNNGLGNVNLTFAHTSSVLLPNAGPITSGTYQPTDHEAGDILTGPAPAGPYGTDLTVFNGTNPNGVWRLFMYDDASFNGGGAIAGGWALNIELISPPVITSHPQSQTVAPGTTVSFGISVSGASPFGFQWLRNGQVLVPFGQGTASLTITNAQTTNAGTYTVVVTNSASPAGITSSNAVLNVLGPLTLVESPQDQQADPGETVQFQVTAAGTPPLNFQWRLNGVIIPYQTNSTLTLSNVQPSSGGAFSVTVFTDNEVFTTAPAVLVVKAASEPPPQDNFSQRPHLPGPQGVMQGDSSNATSERGEPVLPGGGQTVWCEWLAPESGIVTLTAQGSAFDTLLGVFTGTSLNNLTRVTMDDDQGGFYTSKLQFNAIKGTAYQWVLDGFSIGGTGGEFTLTWTLDPGPDQVPVIVVGPQPRGVQQGSNTTFSVVTASAQDSFQWHFNGAPISGATGSTLTISNVQTADVGLYSVVVSNLDGFTVETPPVPLNHGNVNNLVAEDKLPVLNNRPGQGIPISVGLGDTGWNEFPSDGSGEPTDPEPCDQPFFTTLWQNVQAEDDGVMRIDTIDSEVFVLLGIFQGSPSPVTNLNVLVACDLDNGPVNQPSVVQFNAAAGSNYTAVISALQGDGTEVIKLTAMLGRAPPVADFDDLYLIPPGESFLLTMPATNWVPVPVCQWRLNGQNIQGATNPTLLVTNFSLMQTGLYSVVMSNFVRLTTNTVARLELAGPLVLGHEVADNGATLDFVIRVTNAGPFVLATKTDLDPAIPWSPLVTNQEFAPMFCFTNANLLADPRRFFRAMPWPPGASP